LSASYRAAPPVAGAHLQRGWTPQQWLTLRRVMQYAALFVFVALFVWSRRGGWPGNIVNLPMRVDPLAMLAHGLSSRTLLAESALALVTVALTLGLGRVWCGWLCPMGTLLDLFSLRRWRGRRQAPANSWRAAKYGLLLTILAAALLSNLTLLVLDPLTILFRTLAASVWPAVDQIVTAAERALYQFAALRPAVSALDALVRPKLLPPEPAFYRLTLLYAGFLAGIVALNLVASRFWCRYLCPLGGLLGIVGRVGIVRREVNARCNQCQACARVCPTGTIDGARSFASDPSECTMCLECYGACPQGAVEFPMHLSLAGQRSYDPSRRKAVLAMGTALAGVSLLRSDIFSRRDHPRLIRPPGARENYLLSKCLRCGECSRACPTSAIQPAITEAGLEGLWTPVVVPRIGYCDFSCHACGQVCPVQAIPRLTLEAKRQQVIGQAYIDHNRCIAWADHRDCIVCEEMCPVPQKAIVLQQAEVLNRDGERVTVKLPEVVHERCIGCGTCENKCPLNGEAAIRVWVPHDTV
jgi:polyferredoxin